LMPRAVSLPPPRGSGASFFVFIGGRGPKLALRARSVVPVPGNSKVGTPDRGGHENRIDAPLGRSRSFTSKPRCPSCVAPALALKLISAPSLGALFKARSRQERFLDALLLVRVESPVPYEPEIRVVGSRSEGCRYRLEGMHHGAPVVQHASALPGGALTVDGIDPVNLLVGCRSAKIEGTRLGHGVRDNCVERCGSAGGCVPEWRLVGGPMARALRGENGSRPSQHYVKQTSFRTRAGSGDVRIGRVNGRG